MATGSTPLSLPQNAQTAVVTYLNNVLSNLGTGYTLRHQLLKRDLAYYREQQDRSVDQTLAKQANDNGNATKIQNPIVPVVGPQVETTVAYFSDLYLSSYPIFPVVSKPEVEPLALQVDTIFGESAVEFQWARHLGMAFRDGAKYNLMAVEVAWKRKKVYSVTNQPQKDLLNGVPVETAYQGNQIRRLDPYNLILDTRVLPCEIHTKGDFAGYTELMSKIQLKNLFLELDAENTMNSTKAFESGNCSFTTAPGGSNAYYVPQINPDVFLTDGSGGFNWLSWARLETEEKIRYSSMYEVTTLYARVIPREMGIATSHGGVPAIYKFVVVNRTVVIYAERMSNAHNMLPIIVGQLIEDGQGYQTKSVADNAIPYQQIATGLYISGIASQRRKVYDRIIYDPSKINKADIDKVDSVSRIAVKTEAYGKPITDAIHVLPYRDDGVAEIFAVGDRVVEMANVASGINRVQQGQFQKGNKSRFEFSEVMQNSDARPRMMATLVETSFMQPIKHILKTNVLQYQPPTELYNRQTKQPIKIDPANLRTTAWQLKVADGVMPVEKLLSTEMFGQVLQFAMTTPQAAAEYDVLGIWAYGMRLGGATWIDDFKRDEAAQQQYINQVNSANVKPTQPQ